MTRVVDAQDSKPSGARLAARRVLSEQARALDAAAAAIDGSFDRAVELILASTGRVIVSGMGKSGVVGRKLASTLASTGTRSLFVHPAEAFHGDLGMIAPEDVVVLISFSGETDEVVRLLPSLKRFGNRIVAFVGHLGSTLAGDADVALVTPAEREACPNNLAPTTSTTVTMALGDALAVALMERRAISARSTSPSTTRAAAWAGGC